METKKVNCNCTNSTGHQIEPLNLLEAKEEESEATTTKKIGTRGRKKGQKNKRKTHGVIKIVRKVIKKPKLPGDLPGPVEEDEYEVSCAFCKVTPFK